MKKTLLLAAAAILALQAIPAFAEDGGKKHDRGGKMFEMVDTNKDGMISAEENAAFSKKKFDEMDADKNGSVTQEEAKAHHEAKRAEWKAKREAMKAEKAAEKPADAPAEKPAE